MTEKRICETCAHLVWNGGGPYKGHPHCGHYFGRRSGKLVTPAETLCEHHQTQLEKAAGNIIYTSVSDAKTSIERENRPEVLRLAWNMEQAGQHRASLVKLISARLAKLARSK